MLRMRTSRRFPFALRCLFAVVALIAALAYAINSWQVFGFARNVWRLPLLLCFGTAVVADALSLAGLFATYVLRSAPRSVRLYAWLVFGGMTGLSIAAAESFAAWRQIPPHLRREVPVQADAMVASGAVVVALALAVHLLIITVRHAPLGDDLPAPAPAPPAPPPRPQRPAGPPPRPVALRADPTPTRAPVAAEPVPPAPPSRKPRVVRQSGDDRRAAFIQRVLSGESAADVAKDAGVSKRAVEMWVKAHKDRQPERPDLKTPMLGPFHPAPPAETPARTNGAAPDVEVPA